jgi:ABC-type multidrug transport system fused ATPase/permease subunit
VGLYQPAHGRIEFDGLDIQTLDLVSLRRQIGFVPQRPFIFSQTIRQNISADDPGIRFEAIVDAAKRACIHDDIVALPLGYETPVGSFAVFSGGQRQRLSLARALVRNPPIIILDEATSAVDNITEGAIQANIDRLRCTRIVIAHRLSTIRRADRVVLIADGRIVDQGSHGELLERCKEFRDLYGGQELGSYAPGTELD